MEEGRNHNEKVMYMLGEIKNQLASIETQTTKTNGRINKLEDTVEDHGRFIEGIKTKVAMVSVGVGFITFIVGEWIRSKFFSS